MELPLFMSDGKESGKKVKLPESLFGSRSNAHAVYLAVRAQNTNSRQGNASTKTRSMVAGGGKKPWRQKGRGVARAGTIRSPLWVGGGRVFGPHPRSHEMRLPKKVKRLARISVYSDKAKNDQITVIEDFKLANPKTKELYGILKSLGVENKKILLILSDYDATILRAGRNIPNLQIRVAAAESTYDLLDCNQIVLQQGAIEKLNGVLAR